MKYLSFLIILFSVNPLYSQTKKYNFKLPQRDTVAFRPYKLSGTYKNGILFYSIEYEKDFLTPKNEGQSIPSLSTSIESNIKPNGLRGVKFQFEFYDVNSKLLLDTATAFHIDLLDGFAIPPYTDIIRFKYKIPEEPGKVIFTWSFYDQPDVKHQTEKVVVRKTSLIIELNKNNEDYSAAKFMRETSLNLQWQ